MPPAATAEQSPVEAARPNAVAVNVKVFPENSVIFRAGEKLGYGAVQVSVEPHVKQRLTALHDGYLPFNFTLDGSRDIVIRLQHVPSPQPSATHVPSSQPSATSVSDSPSADAADHPAEARPVDGDAHQDALPRPQEPEQPNE